MHFFFRIIDNFIQYGTLQDCSYDAPGPSYTVVTEGTVDEVDKYFSENRNFTIRKAAQILKISKSLLHRIAKNFLKLHACKTTTHQLLTTKSMEARVKFCKIITEMFESGEIDENKLFFPMRLIVGSMDMSINEIIVFGAREIPIFPYYQNLFIQKR